MLPSRRIIALIGIFSLSLSGCSSTNHIGNPLTLPGRAIINGAENTIYGARRGRLENYVRANIAQLYNDIDMGGGPAIAQAMDIARVPEARQTKLLSELAAHPDIYRRPDIEPLIVAIMVHGN